MSISHLLYSTLIFKFLLLFSLDWNLFLLCQSSSLLLLLGFFYTVKCRISSGADLSRSTSEKERKGRVVNSKETYRYALQHKSKGTLASTYVLRPVLRTGSLISERIGEQAERGGGRVLRTEK